MSENDRPPRARYVPKPRQTHEEQMKTILEKGSYYSFATRIAQLLRVLLRSPPREDQKAVSILVATNTKTQRFIVHAMAEHYKASHTSVLSPLGHSRYELTNDCRIPHCHVCVIYSKMRSVLITRTAETKFPEIPFLSLKMRERTKFKPEKPQWMIAEENEKRGIRPPIPPCPGPIHALPDELWIEIFTEVTSSALDLVSFSLVSKRVRLPPPFHLPLPQHLLKWNLLVQNNQLKELLGDTEEQIGPSYLQPDDVAYLQRVANTLPKHYHNDSTEPCNKECLLRVR